MKCIYQLIVALVFVFYSCSCTTLKKNKTGSIEEVKLLHIGQVIKLSPYSTEKHWAVEKRALHIHDLYPTTWEEGKRKIEVVRDAIFGFMFEVVTSDGISFLPYKRRIIHPPMELPDGSISTGYEWEHKMESNRGVGVQMLTYILAEDYELVEGDWLLEIEHNDVVIISEKFETFK